MKLAYIEITPAPFEGFDCDAGPHPVIHQALRILHGIFRHRKSETEQQPFCTAFPDRDRLQVFCADEVTLAGLHNEIVGKPGLRDYVLVSPVRMIEVTKNTPLVEYSRFRIPNRRSLAQGTAHEKHNRDRRSRKIATLREKNLLRFKLRSSSTGADAFIAILQRPWTGGIVESIELKPDSWGLSRKTACFPLPVV